MRRRCQGIGARGGTALVLVACLASATGAQVSSTTTTIPNQYPPALPQRKGPAPPRLSLELVREVPLPGPVAPGPLSAEGDSVRVPLESGSAVAPLAGGEPQFTPGIPPGGSTSPHAWTLHPNGRFRYRGGEGGVLEAEERGPWPRSGWHSAWRLRLPAALSAPPVAIGRRLCFTALDDQAYCVRADNGHRLWATDLGERVSRGPVVWSKSIPVAGPRRSSNVTTLDVLLLVPDSGGTLIALDSYDGSRLTAFELSLGAFVSAPLVVSGDRIAVARQGYDPSDAALAVLKIAAPDARAGPDGAPVPYNDRNAGSPKAPGR